MDFLVNFTHDFLHFSLDCLTELLYFEYGVEDLAPCRSEWLKVVYNRECLILVWSKQYNQCGSTWAFMESCCECAKMCDKI